jgi:hypothetical protein
MTLESKYKVLLKLTLAMSKDCQLGMSALNPGSPECHYLRGKRDGFRTVLSQAARLSSEELDGLLGE